MFKIIKNNMELFYNKIMSKYSKLLRILLYNYLYKTIQTKEFLIYNKSSFKVKE
jgi:hypothetical protein